MRKLLLFISCLILSTLSYAQYALDYGFHLGASNYLGEIGGKADVGKKFIRDMRLDQTRFAAGGFVRYKLFPNVAVKGGLNFIRIEGADSKSTNPGRVGRNLSFRNDLIELEATAHIFVYEIQDLGHNYTYQNDLKVYAIAGVAEFYSNPKTQYKGQWVALQPLKTEGINYSKFGTAIPLGVGAFVTLSKRHRIGWELEWRKTFTDYLDDISSVYPDPSKLKNPTAIALSNRREELKYEDLPSAKNYAPGNKRGDPSDNDSYLTTSFYYSYVIRGRSNFYKAKFGTIFKGKGAKNRKVRAKF